MAKQRVVMFYDLCRLCLENAGAVDMFDTQDLVLDIYTFVKVSVSKDDKLPQKICSKCFDVIYNVKNLNSRATNNDLHLRSLFEDDGDEEGNEVSKNPKIRSTSPEPLSIRERIIFEDDYEAIIQEDNEEPTNECCQSPPETPTKHKAISVRKDIFKTSSVMNVSTRKKSTESILPTIDKQVMKRTKKEMDLDDLVCKVCEKKFDKQKKLYLHQRFHFKNILCPLDACGKKFATKGDLEKHIRTHTGERPYQCEICDKSFAQRGTLKAHRDAVHGEAGCITGK